MRRATRSSPSSETQTFEAIWIFRDELKHPGLLDELEAHTSQPIGMPLHKHRGHISVDRSSVTLAEGEDLRRIPRSEISGIEISYDAYFRRLRDSRGLIPPMHFAFGDEAVYLFTRVSKSQAWLGTNAALREALTGSKAGQS